MNPKQIKAFNAAAEKLGKAYLKMSQVSEKTNLEKIDPAGNEKQIAKAAASHLKSATKLRELTVKLVESYDAVIATLGGSTAG